MTPTIDAELLEKLDEALRCQATAPDCVGGVIECYLPHGHFGNHRTKTNGKWSWEFPPDAVRKEGDAK